MNVLTIDRSKWRRGGDSPAMDSAKGSTQMLNAEGYMCCLGFDALGCGLKPEQILGTIVPGMLPDREVPFHYINRLDRNHAVDDAIEANDASFMLEEKREHLIRIALMKLGWDDVVFVDEAGT